MTISYDDERRLLDHLQDTSNPHLYQVEYLTPGTVSVTGQMTEDIKTEVVGVSGIVRTLPKARTELIGHEWAVLLNVVGTVEITPDTGDTLILPTTDTSISLYNKGESLSFRCLTASSWGIV